MNLFEYIYPRFYFSKGNTVKLFEAFSGVGCQAMALKRITDNYELVGFSEIDKYAIQSYRAIHGEVKNYGDITKMETIPECDIFTYSFPCQDLSLAGNQKGLGEGTRSGLVYEVLRLLKNTEIKPRVLIMENVSALISATFVKQFNEIQLELEQLGYKNYNEILNAKDYGIPQNRERIFMVSILGDYSYTFPEPIKLELRLKDLLEKEVDEKYYLSEKMIKYISAVGTKDFKVDTTINKEIARPITTEQSKRAGTTNYIGDGLPKETKLVQVAQLDGYESSGRIYDENGLCPTINTMQGGGLEPKVAIKTWNEETKAYKTKENDMPRDRIYTEESIGFTITTNESQMPNIAIKEATTKGYAEASDGVYLNRPEQKRGVVQKGMIQTIKTSGNDVGVVVNCDKNLKAQMAETLIEQGKVQEFDVIRHSYTKSRMNGEMKDIQGNNMSPTLDTRADCLGVVVKQKSRGYNKGGQHELCPPITSNSFQENNHLLSGLRIRKLTPLECWRLMGISDEDFWKAQASGMSNAQLYKQAGNGIVVNVFEAILRNLFKE